MLRPFERRPFTAASQAWIRGRGAHRLGESVPHYGGMAHTGIRGFAVSISTGAGALGGIVNLSSTQESLGVIPSRIA
jgi:hypothetical protein